MDYDNCEGPFIIIGVIPALGMAYWGRRLLVGSRTNSCEMNIKVNSCLVTIHGVLQYIQLVLHMSAAPDKLRRRLHPIIIANLYLLSAGPTHGCQCRLRSPCSHSHTRTSTTTDSTFLFAVTLDDGTRIMTSARGSAI